MSYFDCWQSDEHARLFDYRDYFASFRLAKIYANFNEFNLFRKFVNDNYNGTLLEVGCATGASYRFFKKFYKNIKYTGADISKSALTQAQRKYPHGNFIQVDSESSKLSGKKFDFVFCRDVVLHQTGPFEFLTKLSTVSQKGIFLRLRTRDKGATELNVEKSCQINYGAWAPYIIINADELISYFKEMPRCRRIVLNKNYMVLGGVNSRFLPKDCYLSEIGTAETAVYAEFGDGEVQEPEVIVEILKDASRFSFVDRLLNKCMRILTGSKINSRIWW